MPTYPKRDSCYAHKYTRLLFNSTAAADIGLDGVAMCVHIAHMEDKLHYGSPVKLWNAHLEHALCASEDKVKRIRDKCTKFDFLHYERDSNRKIATYWVKVPEHLQGMIEGPTNTRKSAGNAAGNKRSNTRKSADNHAGNHAGTSFPVPNPSKQAGAGEIPDEQLSKEQRTFALNLHKDFVAILKVKSTDNKWWAMAKQVACDESAQLVTMELLDEITESKGSIKKPDLYFNSKFDDNLETAKALSKGGA